MWSREPCYHKLHTKNDKIQWRGKVENGKPVGLGNIINFETKTRTLDQAFPKEVFN